MDKRQLDCTNSHPDLFIEVLFQDKNMLCIGMYRRISMYNQGQLSGSFRPITRSCITLHYTACYHAIPATLFRNRAVT